METIFPEDTPLAAYLQGEGIADDSFNYQNEHTRSPSLSAQSSSSESPSFAPHIAPASTSASAPAGRRLKRFRQSLQLRRPQQGSLFNAHTAWSRAVKSRIRGAENAQFLEHFRYVIVASQLLNEYPDLGSLHTARPDDEIATTAPRASELTNQSVNITGVVITVGIAFSLVLLIHWARGSRISTSRVLLALTCLAVLGVLFYAHVRRQWLKHLRRQAVNSISDLTTNIKGFELTSTAALSLIQEVELVSKGYRLSTPLPPISRFEDVKGNRKCARLRKCLQKAYAAVLPALRDSHASLKPLLDEDSLEKFLDVYDIPYHAIQEAINPDLMRTEEHVDDDDESLKSLRLVGYQYTTLRRVVLCALMSLEADGAKPDFPRWRAAIENMTSLSLVMATWAEKLNNLLRETEHFTMPITPKLSARPANERLRAQVRNITNVSSGIRSLQAKMALMREESSKAIESSEDLTELGPDLIIQYESIGADLKMLMQAWEAGKASLANNIDKQERRISLASSGLRSPALSLGGLTAVEEGGPADALRALLGETKSDRSSLAASASDEEIFEGISIPRQRPRSTLTREERIAMMNEERSRNVELKQKRESNTNMIRELQSVMTLRNPSRNPVGRITSV